MRCGYIRWIWDCGNTREVEEKHTGRYGARGQKRQKRRKATPEEIAKQNQWKKERDVRRLIKWNFGIGDYWFTLTYKKGSRPPWKQMQKDMISPSGSRSYRKGTVYLMFYEETKGIMVKVFGETPVDITYRYFLDVVHSLFDEYDAGAHTWEKCFGVLPDEGTTAQKQEEPVEPKMPEHSGKNIGNVHGDISAEKVMEKPEIAPAQQEEQIPGQDSIDQHPEYMPEPVQEPDIPKKPEDSVPGIHKEEQKSDPVPENNETIPEAIPEKAITRKEYLETLTLYGWADYVAAAMRTFGSIPFSRLREISFWEEWLRGKVDKKGRPWIE